METVKIFEDEIDECLLKRFISDMLCLPETHKARLEVCLNNKYKEYYLNLYRTQLEKLQKYAPPAAKIQEQNPKQLKI